MPSETKAKIVLSHFNWSLERLKEAIAKEDTEYYRGAALQRFGLTYDMALKTIHAFANDQGDTCTNDASCFQWVVDKQWLKKDADWEVMLADYQAVQQRPEGADANKIYDALIKYYVLFNHLSECMKSA